MYVDQVIKLINKVVDSFEYSRDINQIFEIPQKSLILLPKFLGDILLLTPILRNLKYNFGPKSQIDVVCDKSHHNLLKQSILLIIYIVMILILPIKENFWKIKNMILYFC